MNTGRAHPPLRRGPETEEEKLPKKYCGTSHVLSKDGAKFVFEKGCNQLIIGSGSAAGAVAPRSTAPTKRSRKRKADTAAAPPASTQPNSVTGTPLRIPYGNNEVALKLGAAIAPVDGMLHLESIFLHSESVDGCKPQRVWCPLRPVAPADPRPPMRSKMRCRSKP
jgi:hypothetical protein